MAIRVTKELVCDKCGSDKDVQRYRIQRTRDSKRVSPDLCSVHSEPIEDLFKSLSSRGRRSTKPVLTEAEIVAKRTRKK